MDAWLYARAYLELLRLGRVHLRIYVPIVCEIHVDDKFPLERPERAPGVCCATLRVDCVDGANIDLVRLLLLNRLLKLFCVAKA